jgi:PAS domain S-box-containing protein
MQPDQADPQEAIILTTASDASDARLLKTPIAAMIDLLPDAAFLYDRSGRIVRTSAATRLLFALDTLAGYDTMPYAERVKLLAPRALDGHPLPQDEWHITRILRGEVVTSAHPVLARVSSLDGREMVLSYTGAPIRDERDGSILGAIAIGRDVTAHLQLESVIAVAERQFRAVFEQAASGIVVAALDGRLLRMNERFRELLGYSAEELTWLNFREFTHPDDLAEELPRVRALIAGEIERYTMEKRYIRQDGSLLWVEIFISVIRAPDGTPEYLLGVVQDISQRRRLEDERDRLLCEERAARASAEAIRARLEAVLDVLPMGVGIVDQAGGLIQCNPAFTRVWGNEASLAARMAEYENYHGWWPNGQPIEADEWALSRALLRGEIVADEETDIEAFTGERKIILNNAAPIRDAAGTIVGGVGAFLDVTERRRLERRTRQAFEALLRIAEALVRLPGETNSPSASLATSGAYEVVRQLAEMTRAVIGCERVTITTLDPASESIIPLAGAGFSAAEQRQWQRALAGYRLDAFHPSERMKLLHAGEAFVAELERDPARRDSAAEHVTRRALIVPIRLSERLIGILSLSFDAPEHRYTADERDFAAVAAKLAALALERDRLLRERAAVEAQVLALKETNRLMNEFLGIAGHELRTPLTAIRANAQLANQTLKRLLAEAEREPPDPAFIRDRLLTMTERIEKQSRRQERLVNDLLDISRIEAGRLELHPRPADLAAIVRECVEEQQLLNPERSLTLRLPRDAGGTVASVLIHADADRIGQVVTNYLTNALKYSPAEEPVAVSFSLGDGLARVAVRDRGPGLSRQQQVRIWERFQRAEGIEVLNGSGIGLGLGLFIVKTIIERHGGETGVESARGKGASFWFTVPLAE